MQKPVVAYLMARLAIGMSFFGHGLIRLTRLSVFADGMIKEFSKSLLPQWLVIPFAYTLPFVEISLGILLLTGLFIDIACIAGVIVMLCLIFGSSFLEQWNNIFSQLFYSAYLVALYRYSEYNGISKYRQHNKPV